MPSSTRYSGNPFISRRERQASVALYNKKAEEVNKEAVYVQRILSNVKVDITLDNSFTTDGIKRLATCKLYVDLRDGNKGYVNFDKWDETANSWTIHPGLDYFVANDKKFMINSLTEKFNIKGGIDILEIVGNE